MDVELSVRVCVTGWRSAVGAVSHVVSLYLLYVFLGCQGWGGRGRRVHVVCLKHVGRVSCCVMCAYVLPRGDYRPYKDYNICSARKTYRQKMNFLRRCSPLPARQKMHFWQRQKGNFLDGRQICRGGRNGNCQKSEVRAEIHVLHVMAPTARKSYLPVCQCP